MSLCELMRFCFRGLKKSFAGFAETRKRGVDHVDVKVRMGTVD